MSFGCNFRCKGARFFASRSYGGRSEAVSWPLHENRCGMGEIFGARRGFVAGFGGEMEKKEVFRVKNEDFSCISQKKVVPLRREMKERR